jgi:Cu/Ag efflux protein CusF
MQEKATNGMKLLGMDKGIQQVQASWRFFNNPKVTSKDLFEPVKDSLKDEIINQCDKFVLAVSDWSHLDYKKHTTKKELKSENRKDTCKKIGYDLQSTIAVSDRTGKPIAPMVHNLKTANKVYSTYDDNIDMKLTHLEELSQRAIHIKDEFKSDKQIVHVVDRESDSIAFMRDLVKSDILFVLRGKGNSTVQYTDTITNTTIKIKQSDLADKLPLGKEVKKIKYRNKKVTIFANECDIEITRDATKMTLQSNGRRKLVKTKGESVKTRFVVERLVNDKQEVVAMWLLISNVYDKTVDASTIATWYYYK